MRKTYRNKLYSIPDVAKRAEIEESQLYILIAAKAVKCEKQFGVYYIGGEEISSIKKKWEVYEWFKNLDDRVKEEIIEVLFPDDIIYDVDESWNRLDWKIRLGVYEENNP